MNPLRIHFFVSSVRESGTFFRFHNLASGLTRLGQNVTVFGCDVNSPSGNRTEIRHGVRYEIVAGSMKSSIFSQGNHPLTAIRRRSRQYPACDIKHLFQPFWSAAAPWRKNRARLSFYDWDDQWIGGFLNSPVSSWREIWPRFMTKKLESSLPELADHTTVVSHHLERLAMESGARRSSIIHNGFNRPPFVNQADARTELGLDSTAIYVGFMGRAHGELEWCFSGVDKVFGQVPNLRFAICGESKQCLEGLPQSLLERVDYLGQLTPAECRLFAASLDLGLVPLNDTTFNQSRFPIKFFEHLSTGVPVLCSEVGEIGRLATVIPGVFLAGSSRDAWISGFQDAVRAVAAGNAQAVDVDAIEKTHSWDSLSLQLLQTYLRELGRPECKSIDADSDETFAAADCNNA